MNLQTYIIEIIAFLEKSILPFLLAIAFLVFIWNVVQYFIIEAINELDKAKARSYMLWSIIAFVVIIIFWGLMNLLITASGFGGDADPITPDYMKERQAPTGPAIDNTCIVNPETCDPNANAV